MEIWIANADGSGARNVTRHPSDDTAPCWSPTDHEIAFTSDRTGEPQLWVMDNEGLNQLIMIERRTALTRITIDACNCFLNIT